MDNISKEEVKELLDDMVKMGFIRVLIDDEGVERYELTELGRLEMAFQSE
jgi:DNA-binding PadR family transcriptional regulator